MAKATDFRYNTGATRVPWAAVGEKSDEYLLKKCSKSKKAEISICHAGLTNIVAPILLTNEIIGYVMLGQIREKYTFSELSKKFTNSENADLLAIQYQNLISYDRPQIESAARMVAMLTASIVAEELIQLDAEEMSEKINVYISKNLSGDLSLKTLCRELNISKNTLYKTIRSVHNCTLNEYITKCRIDYAKKLLKNSTQPIRVISAKIGFDDESYFCRLFKRTIGCTPTQYRKAHQ